MHLTMEIDESKGTVQNKSDALDRALKVVRTRIDELGVATAWLDADPREQRGLVARAWQLDDLGRRYEDAVASGRAALAGAGEPTGADALRLLHRITIAPRD